MQFSLKELFLATTITALGASCWPLAKYLTAYYKSWGEQALGLLIFILMLSGGALVGTGIAAPFRRKALGAVLGFGLGLAGVYYFIQSLD